jgi:hypothetical protein
LLQQIRSGSSSFLPSVSHPFAQSYPAIHLPSQQHTAVAAQIPAPEVSLDFSSTKARKFKTKLTAFCH